jgi:aspartate racemase
MTQPDPGKSALKVGIMGGMGPQATVDLMRRVISLTPASDDCDHIRMLVDCDPTVPSRVRAIIDDTGPSPAPALARMAKSLEDHGADFLAMPCNTAHHYYADIVAAVDIPVINILENTARRIQLALTQGRNVGMLASRAVSLTSLYDPHFFALGKTILYPDDELQDQLMTLIFDVKANRLRPGDQRLQTCARSLSAAGADCLLIACTELSVIADSLDDAGVPVFDAADLLAREIVDVALQRAAR